MRAGSSANDSAPAGWHWGWGPSHGVSGLWVYPSRLSWIANFANLFASKYLRSPWSPTGFSAVRSTRIGRRRDAAARRKQEDIRWRRTRCANATTAYGLHVLLIPEKAGGAACGLPGTDTASTGGKPDRRIRGNLAQFGGSSARPPVIGVAPLARDSIQGFFGCSQGSRSGWKGY